MKTAILLATARPRVVLVVDALIENLQAHGHDPRSVSVYLSIDTALLNTHESDFELGSRTRASLNSVKYITQRRRYEMAKRIASKVELPAHEFHAMLIGRGYSQQRNAALLAAILDRNDIAVFVDDDENPTLPILDDSRSLQWTNRDFLGPHLDALRSGADVTRGLILGYASPIPAACEEAVPEEVRKRLGRVLCQGSDVIFEDSFVNMRDKIRYLTDEQSDPRKRPFVVEGSSRGKGLMGGNMGINLHSVMQTDIPLFYAPAQARGEDSFFALQLSDQTVVEVASYLFHDPFDQYPGLLNGVFPTRLEPTSVTPAHVDRFCSALHGWLKYAPLFIKMTSLSEAERTMRIDSMLSGIEDPTENLAQFLRHDAFRTCLETLQRYAAQVDQHFFELQGVQTAWRDRIKPLL